MELGQAAETLVHYIKLAYPGLNDSCELAAAVEAFKDAERRLIPRMTWQEAIERVQSSYLLSMVAPQGVVIALEEIKLIKLTDREGVKSDHRGTQTTAGSAGRDSD